MSFAGQNEFCRAEGQAFSGAEYNERGIKWQMKNIGFYIIVNINGGSGRAKKTYAEVRATAKRHYFQDLYIQVSRRCKEIRGEAY